MFGGGVGGAFNRERRSWKVAFLGAQELAPHTGHVSNFRGVSPPLFEPAELLHGLEESGRAGTGIHAGRISNCHLGQFPCRGQTGSQVARSPVMAYLQDTGGCSILSLEDSDEAFDLCSLCYVCVWQSERAEAGLAAIAGAYADTDMAGGGP